LHDKTIFGSSLSFCYLLCVLLYGSLFCDDHQLVDVSRCEEHPWSTGRWWFRCLVDWTWALLFMSFAKAMAHVFYWLVLCFWLH